MVDTVIVPDVNLVVSLLDAHTRAHAAGSRDTILATLYASPDPALSDLAQALDEGRVRLAHVTCDVAETVLTRTGYDPKLAAAYVSHLVALVGEGNYYADLTWANLRRDGAAIMDEWQRDCPALAAPASYRSGPAPTRTADLEDAVQARVVEIVADRNPGHETQWVTRDKFAAAAVSHTCANLADDGRHASVRVHVLNQAGYQTGVVTPDGELAAFTPDYTFPASVATPAATRTDIDRAWRRIRAPRAPDAAPRPQR